MSELTQFPQVPKRPRNAPGNDGYVLYRRPGFAEEQTCHRIRYEAPISGLSPIVRVNLNYPHIKLGANNYVLDIERVVVTYRDLGDVFNVTSNALSATDFRKCLLLDCKGLSNTLLSDSSSHREESYYQFDFPVASGFFNDPNTIYTFLRPEALDVHAYGLPISKDDLTLSFDLHINQFVTGDANVKWGGTAVFSLVVRPNPCKATYFDL
jgi:hypothetical protein